MNIDLKSEYERIFNNYDKCLNCLEKIISYAKDKNDIRLAFFVQDCIESLVTESKKGDTE